ncbi:MAG: LLM class flavin-dependent oxidoreductase [Acidimicrobiales bacterium]
MALAAEIADGWLPIFLSPSLDVHYRECLAEGFARPGARRTLETFEIPNLVNIVVGDDVEACADVVRMFLGFYIGGMGAKEVNFHANLFARMGYGDAVEEIQDLFLAGRKDEAIKGCAAGAGGGRGHGRPARQGPRGARREVAQDGHDHAAGERRSRSPADGEGPGSGLSGGRRGGPSGQGPAQRAT